jgi:hypothetical protein
MIQHNADESALTNRQAPVHDNRNQRTIGARAGNLEN